MKIVVAVKQVPERDAGVRVAADGRSVDESDVAWTMNEPDAYALEEALQLKERAGAAGLGEGEVVVLCAGPERVQSTLREALAKGADRAVHVVTPETWGGLAGAAGHAGRGAAAGCGGEGRDAGPGADGVAVR